MDLRTALKQGLAQLRAARVPSHTLAAELLLLHVLGRDRTWIYAHPEEEIAQLDAERYFALIVRRSNGEPTQHLTGKQEFWGLEFEVTPDVLIPRPETEHVIEVALDRLAGVIEKLLVYPEAMKRNLEKQGGLVHSERVLLALVQKGLAREEAYKLVQRNAMKAWAGEGDFLGLLKRDPQVIQKIRESELEALFDLNHHLKHVDTIFQRVFGKA